MPPPHLLLDRESMFQSTPPVAEGRCVSAGVMAVRPGSFNPRPPLPRGDASADRRRRRQCAVSIHAPRCRGAMRPLHRLHPLVPRFQSTPPVAEGRCPAPHRAAAGSRHVSIHAPRCRGAMPWRRWRICRECRVSIHAPRCRGAMPIGHWLPAGEQGCFNPRPPLPRGDAHIAGIDALDYRRFNPRPPLPRGDAAVDSVPICWF